MPATLAEALAQLQGRLPRVDARDREVRFRSLDGRWQCVDMFACRAREQRRRAEVAAGDALERAVAKIEAGGWAI